MRKEDIISKQRAELEKLRAEVAVQESKLAEVKHVYRENKWLEAQVQAMKEVVWAARRHTEHRRPDTLFSLEDAISKLDSLKP